MMAPSDRHWEGIGGILSDMYTRSLQAVISNFGLIIVNNSLLKYVLYTSSIGISSVSLNFFQPKALLGHLIFLFILFVLQSLKEM